MKRSSMLLLRSGFHREFAYKTIFRSNMDIAIIERPYVNDLAFADYPYIIDDIWNPQKMFDIALKVYHQIKFDGVATFSDSSIIALGMLSDYLGLDYFSEETARVLANKLEVRKRLSKAGVEGTRFFEINSFEDLEKAAEMLGYPLVLKPTDRTASKGVVKICDRSLLEKEYKDTFKISKNKKLLAEKYLTGTEFCVEVVVYKHEPYVVSITKKNISSDKYCIKLAAITPAPIADSLKKKIKSFIKEAVGQFDIANSILHIEIRADENDKVSLVELNPRPAGGGMIENIYKLKGMNLYDYAFAIALKQEIDVNRLKAEIERPFNGYALYYPFINPVKSGTVDKVCGIEEVSKELSQGKERITLAFRDGDFLPMPKTNEDVRGYIYLLDEDSKRIEERSEKIAKLIDFKLKE